MLALLLLIGLQGAEVVQVSQHLAGVVILVGVLLLLLAFRLGGIFGCLDHASVVDRIEVERVLLQQIFFLLFVHFEHIKFNNVVTQGAPLFFLLVLRLEPGLAAVSVEDVAADGDSAHQLLVHELVEADHAFLLVERVHHSLLRFVKLDFLDVGQKVLDVPFLLSLKLDQVLPYPLSFILIELVSLVTQNIFHPFDFLFTHFSESMLVLS